MGYSDDSGANAGGENESNLFTECCNMNRFGQESCTSFDNLFFPPGRTCDFLGVAFAMPTCWDGKSIGDDNDHKSHMAYTTNGRVDGPCPSGFSRRLPQVQLFVRINNYDSRSKSYQLSDGADVFHVDFFNAWKEGKLQEIIDNCEVDDSGDFGYNPPCACTPDSEDGSNFVTINRQVASPVCDSDVRRLIIDEPTDMTSTLPSGSCTGRLIPRSWDTLTDNVFECVGSPTSGDPNDEEEDMEEEDEGDEDMEE